MAGTEERAFTLNDIAGWEEDNCADQYMNNLDRISQYGTKDISDTLSKMDLLPLTVIHNAFGKEGHNNISPI